MSDRFRFASIAAVPALALALAAGTAFAAAPEVAAPAPSYVRELLGIVVPLGFMILALLLVLRLLRRRFGITGSGAHLSVLQILPVGPRERVVLLQTRAGRILAIGVSAQSVNLIARLERDDVAAVDDDAAT
ncbi:MAG: flagellar biosynthetic protein FliO [Gammaproteobacteria bacterium]|nr:flagellar biosynthetic protein FliO [Gammaproteobacteria bacterium]